MYSSLRKSLFLNSKGKMTHRKDSGEILHFLVLFKINFEFELQAASLRYFCRVIDKIVKREISRVNVNFDDKIGESYIIRNLVCTIFITLSIYW